MDSMGLWIYGGDQLLLDVPQAWTRDEGVCLVILTCSFLYSAELTEKNIKVLIVLERSMRRHKPSAAVLRE